MDVMNDIERTRKCDCKGHNHRGSPFATDRVPEKAFRKIVNDPYSPLWKTCDYCRLYDREVDKRQREKHFGILSSDELKCSRCYKVCDTNTIATRITGDKALLCKTCNDKQKEYAMRKYQQKCNVKRERVIKVGHSCEKCRKIFLSPPTGSTIVRQVDTYDGYVIHEGLRVSVFDFIKEHNDCLEVRQCEWDHYSKSEWNVLHPDIEYVPKRKRGLDSSSLISYTRETEKCRLLCALCHMYVTNAQRKKGKRYGAEKVKRDFVNTYKISVGKCILCNCWHPDNLAYFEFDHQIPSEKVDSISYMVISKLYTLDDIKQELATCRLLCRSCHLIHTRIQHDDGTLHGVRNKKKKVKYTEPEVKPL